ncbi:MAG: LCP family protein [Oscillatoriaceae bacterium SKW80]|nr:LCP family protein [Oscillatoriaceae bacterium SKYG93]MCX8121285.1 LCP family protein [Oscillatoriaceae bacterium SKW80]MDW8453381.1 LCP family protein [Oscillatoriaceae cyanobacterium SKYGB_i_bin93]
MPTQNLPHKSLPKTHKLNQTNRQQWLWLGLGLTGIAMLSATAGALLAVSLASTPLMQSRLTAEEAAIFGRGERISTSMSMKLPELTRPVNILIIGTKVLTSDLDDYPQNNLGYHALVNSLDGLADTILLVRFNPDSKQLTVLSIPRDTRTFVEGIGTTKINEANYKGGPALSAKAVSQLLGGVGIDRYVRINVQAIEKLVDALGGVTIYVPKDMKYKDDSQHLYINLKAGKQKLNGNQAQQFLRFRYDELGDIGRIQRQQMLIRALIEQTLNPAIVLRIPKILSVIQEHIDTNLSIEELVALVGFASEIHRSNVQMLMLPGQFSDPKEYKSSFWLPDYNSIDAMVARHFDFGENYWAEEGIDPSNVRVAIQDSTGSEKAVEQFINNLKEAGYRNTFISKPWSEPLKVTRIIAQQGDIEIAKTMREVLGFGEVRVESTGSLQSDVTIQLGYDWVNQPHSFKPLKPSENW